MRELPIHAAMKRRTAFAVALATVLLPIGLIVGIAALRTLVLGESFEQAVRAIDLVTASVVQALSCGFVIWLVLVREAPPVTAGALGLVPVTKTTLVVAALAGFAMHFVLAEIANVVEVFVPRDLEQKLETARRLAPTNIVAGAALVLNALVVAPVSEELVFRGLVLPRLALYTGALEAIVLTAFLFGASHAAGGLSVVIPACVAGLALAHARRATRSVLPAIALHAGSNAVPLLLPSTIVRVPGLNVLRDGPSHLSPVVVLTAAVATLLALFALSRDPHGDGDDRA